MSHPFTIKYTMEGELFSTETDANGTKLQEIQPKPNSDKRQINRNRNRKLWISRPPTKAKSQEPAYSQALNQNKVDRQRSRSRESGRQTVRGYGGWCLELRWGGRYGDGDESG